MEYKNQKLGLRDFRTRKIVTHLIVYFPTVKITTPEVHLSNSSCNCFFSSWGRKRASSPNNVDVNLRRYGDQVRSAKYALCMSREFQGDQWPYARRRGRCTRRHIAPAYVSAVVALPRRYTRSRNRRDTPYVYPDLIFMNVRIVLNPDAREFEKSRDASKKFQCDLFWPSWNWELWIARIGLCRIGTHWWFSTVLEHFFEVLLIFFLNIKLRKQIFGPFDCDDMTYDGFHCVIIG